MHRQRHLDRPLVLARLGICLAAMAATGCLTAVGPMPPRAEPTSGDLDRWVSDELTPYVVTQLSQHPRFRAEPVLLVSMSGDVVEPDIDALTSSIRDQIQSALVATRGARLYWRPAEQPWLHHRSLEDLRCDEQRRIRYLIGIDVKKVPGSDLAVAVRALDYLDRGWVSGFGRQWQGPATPSQIHALAQRRTDEYLRGLRVLPFGPEQADLMAAYLAHNLSCLVRELGESQVVLRTEPLRERDAFFGRVYDLVRLYLSRFREVRLASEESDADFALRGEVYAIHGGLHQMWVVIESQDGNHALAGADTEAYADLGREMASRPPRPLPNPAHEDDAVVAAAPILSSPRLMRPTDPSACDQSLPWASRSHATAGQPVLPPRACFAIETDVERSSHVFVLSHDDTGALNRLLPSSCRAVRQGENTYHGGQTLRFPQPAPGHGAPFLVSHRPGVETYYIIAASGTAAIRDVASHLSTIGDACGHQRRAVVHRREFLSWLTALDALSRRHGGAIQWRSLEVRHAY